MKSSKIILDALRQAVRLGEHGHSFIIGIRGPKEVAANFATTVQVVDRNRLDGGDCGLSLYLPFAGGNEARLARLKGLPEFDLFSDVSYDPDFKCYASFIGTNATEALRIVLLVLEQVYGYSKDDDFECSVFDEGSVGGSAVDVSEPGSKISFKSIEEVRAYRAAGLANDPTLQNDLPVLFHGDLDPANADWIKTVGKQRRQRDKQPNLFEEDAENGQS